MNAFRSISCYARRTIALHGARYSQRAAAVSAFCDCFFHRRLAVCAMAAALSACASVSEFGQGMGNMADKALETIGYKKPELPHISESAKPPRPMRLQVAASDSLNLDPQDRSLSLVVRVFKLRNPSAFLGAPYDTFGDAAKEKLALGEDLIDVKELVLAPSHKRGLNETWAREATHVGVVGLFREPAPRRWRYVFDIDELKTDQQQFVLGAHACALSVAFGTPVGIDPLALRLQSTDCAPLGRLGAVLPAPGREPAYQSPLQNLPIPPNQTGHTHKPY